MTGNVINKILLPFSWIYGWVVWFRNKLFDRGILPGEEFSVPVISIGNITVGGTGKTPHTEYLIRLLSPRFKVAVLSRGYKRKSSGFVLADATSNSSTLGDEPCQMCRKFPQILVAVDKNRRRGIARLLALPEDKRPDVVLLDDAFQHRYVVPSLSILLVDSNRPIYNDLLLPAGRLRESVENKSRADIVIVTKCPDSLEWANYKFIEEKLKLSSTQALYFTSFRYGTLIPVFGGSEMKEQTLEEVRINKTNVLLLAGIASPQGLIDELKQYADELEILLFPDHHHFSDQDMRSIQQALASVPGENKMIITTEKDAVRLINTELNPELKRMLYYLPITVVFRLEQEEIFKQKIEEHVKDFTRNRIMA